eukprot:3208478-Pyramimonas_sp.AAC.1
MPIPTLTEGLVAISNGHVGNIATDWVTHVSSRDGKRWVTCDRSNAGFCKYVKDSFEMLEFVQALRASKCEQLMAQVGQAAADPAADASESPEAPMKKAKKVMVDDIPGDRIGTCPT